jgi:hypothetical protein
VWTPYIQLTVDGSTLGPKIGYYAGTPETHVVGAVGDLCIDSATGILYHKATGTGNTGWVQDVTSVAERVGAVALTAADIAPGTFPAGTFIFGGDLQISNGYSLIITRGTGTNRDAYIKASSVYNNVAELSVYPSSGTNVKPGLVVIPRGTGFSVDNKADITIYNTDFIATPANYEDIRIRAMGSTFQIFNEVGGSGTWRPIYLSAQGPGVGQLVLAINGNVGIGFTAPLAKLAINGGLNVGDTADPGDNNLSVVGNTNIAGYVGVPGYVSQLTGWRGTAAGAWDMRYLFVDEMHAKAFVADFERALAGGEIVSKSVAIIAADFTLPAAGASTTFIVEDLAEAPNIDVFEASDFLRFRQFTRTAGSLTIADSWGTVSATAHTHNGDGTQTWTFARSAGADGGTGSGTIKKGQLTLDYGVSGNGIHEITTVDGLWGVNSPYSQVVTWTTHPKTGQVVRERAGNLAGVGPGTWGYGLYAGKSYGATDGQYIVASDQLIELHGVDISLWDGATNVFAVRRNTTSPYLSLGSPAPSAYGANAGIFMEWNHGAGKARVSYYADANNYWQYDGTKLVWKAANTTLDSSGNFTATSGTFQTAGSGARVVFDSTGIKGYDAGPTLRFSVLTDGSGTLGTNGIAWTTAGVVTMAGFIVNATELYAGSGATRVEVQAAGGFWAGATAFADAPASISAAGVAKFTNATITGAIIATSGSFIGDGGGITNQDLGFDPWSLVLNGGGEIGTIGVQATSWLYNQGDGLLVAEDAKHGGTRSLKFTSAADMTSYSYQTFAVESGATYEVSFWLKTSALSTGKPGWGAALLLYPAAATIQTRGCTAITGTYTGLGLPADNAAHDWTLCYQRFKPSSASLTVYATLGYDDVQAGSVWWDGISIRRFAAIYATDIVANTITASQMDVVGGWTWAADYLKKDGATDADSAGLAPSDYPFYAGKKYVDRATAPFRVLPTGHVVMADADVTGAIHGTSGYFGDSSNRVTVASTGLDVGSTGTIVGGTVTIKNSGIQISPTTAADAPHSYGFTGGGISGLAYQTSGGYRPGTWLSSDHAMTFQTGGNSGDNFIFESGSGWGTLIAAMIRSTQIGEASHQLSDLYFNAPTTTGSYQALVVGPDAQVFQKTNGESAVAAGAFVGTLEKGIVITLISPYDTPFGREVVALREELAVLRALVLQLFSGQSSR